MKLLIPNAKELNTNQDAFSYQELSQKPQAILDILTDFSVEDLNKGKENDLTYSIIKYSK